MIESKFRYSPLLSIKQKFLLIQNVAKRPITMKIIRPPDDCEKLDHDEKNMKLKRPMSPHLPIYKMQLTSILSLSHRATGMWLMVYVWILSFGSHIINLPGLIEYLHGVQFPAILIIVLKFILSYPLSYHLINGLRHFLWDMGAMLKLKQVYSTGYVMLVLSCIGSAICAAL